MSRNLPALAAPAGARARPHRGFALVLTVILLSFLMLVLVSTATLTRIETKIGVNSRRDAQAQQNARLALNRALGELQRHLGPDRRVTATAAITGLSSSDPHRNWTGVWSVGGSAAPDTWLISGNEDLASGSPVVTPEWTTAGFDTSMTALTLVTMTPPAGAPRAAMTLVGPMTTGAFTTENYVAAPLVDLLGTAPDGGTNVTMGRYAWWVGDESVKASIAETERHEDLAFADLSAGDDYTDPVNRDRVAQLALPRQRIEAFGDDFDDISVTGSGAAQLEKVVTRAQLSFVSSGPSAVEQRPEFHDFTVCSHGVLANTAAGGLKADLSFAGPAVPEELRWRLDLRPAASVEATARYTLEKQVKDGTMAAGPYFWVAPVISEVRVFLNFVNPQTDAPTGTIATEWSWEIEFWNPYNVEIDLRQVQLAFENVGVVTVAAGSSDTVDLFQTISNGLTGAARFEIHPEATAPAPLENWMGIFADASLPGGIMRPGQVVTVGKTGSGNARNTAGLSVIVDPSSSYTVGLEPTSPAATSPLAFRFEDATGTLIRRYQPQSLSSTPPVSGPRYFVLQFRLQDQSDDPGWLGEYNPNATEIVRYSGGGTSADPFDGARTSGLSATAPTAAAGEAITAGAFMVAFDLPRGQEASIGSLQHLSLRLPAGALENAPAFLIGNPYGVTIADPFIGSGTIDPNSAFDRYFFSTLPHDPFATWNPLSDPLPNTRIVLYRPDPSVPADVATMVGLGADANDQVPASRLLVRGAFNVNSTSTDAWRALLTGTAIFNWQYWNGGSVEGEDLDNAFFRLAHTAQEIGAGYASEPSATEAWRQGGRELEDDQIDDLADEIVTRILARGQPFDSLAEFLSSGLLQDAIDDVNPPGPTPPINAGLDALSPAFLTQADLMNSWAPFLQARSDTFVVRAYGEAMNAGLDPDGSGPLSGPVEARAWCEAVVQRVPDYANIHATEATPPEPTLQPWELPGVGTDNERFGRRFKIVQFRWLSPSDI